MVASQPRFAGFLIRTAAYLIDAFLLGLVGGAFPYLVIGGATSNPTNQSTGAASGGFVIAAIYMVLLWSHIGGGRTIGMRLLGLQVVREDGQSLNVGDAILRLIGLWVSFAVCFIGVLWVAGDARKQGWHDKLAHTVVIHV